MDVKPGYKWTEIGVVPEDWQVALLGNMTTKVGSGITPTGGERVYKREGRPFLRSQNIGWGKLIMEGIAFIDEGTHETFKATEVMASDVLLNITGASIGRSAVADKCVAGGNVNQHVCIIRPDRAKLDPSFVNYFLLSRPGQEQIDGFQAGGNRQGLNFAQIRSFHLPLPPVTEQRTIATALNDVDALITSLDKLIAKKRDIKQAAMQQLLTGKARLPGFSGEWEVKKLGEVAEIDNDNLNGSTNPEYAFKYISLEDVDTGVLQRYTELSFRHAPSRARRRIKKNDVLISTVRPNLQSHLLIKEQIPDLICSTGFSALRCFPAIADPGYVYFHLFGDEIKRQIEGLLTGSNYPAINSGHVKVLGIPFPPLPEQQAIATVLSDMDAEIVALEQRREKTRALKQGMLQELLTGKTRLV